MFVVKFASLRITYPLVLNFIILILYIFLTSGEQTETQGMVGVMIYFGNFIKLI